MTIRSYSELRRFDDFEDRFEYLRLNGAVGSATFGYDRWLNQDFYRSREWKNVRQHVIARDLGRDLGVEGYEIHSKILVHHMNPMTSEDIERGSHAILDPEYLITTTHDTHNAIHYGDVGLLRRPYVERQRGDTRLW